MVSIQDTPKGLDSLLLVLLGQMGIAHGHLKALVTEKLFDRGKVCPVHDQMTGEGMAEAVEAEVCDPSPVAGLPEDFLSGSDRIPLTVQKHVGMLRIAFEPLEGIPDGGIHLDGAVLSIL